MNDKTQVEGDPSPIVAPTPEPAGGSPSVEADHQHHRQEEPPEGPDIAGQPPQVDPDIDTGEGDDDDMGGDEGDGPILDDQGDAGGDLV